MSSNNASSNERRALSEGEPTASASLAELRAEIERVDATIISAIAERMQLARAVGRLKAATGQAVTDPAREAAVVARASVLAREAGLPEDEIRALYWRLLAVSRRAQHDLTCSRRESPSAPTTSVRQ
jgi:chorismate mutase